MIDNCSPLMKYSELETETASLSEGEMNNYRYQTQPVLSLELPDFSTKKAELILISWLK